MAVWVGLSDLVIRTVIKALSLTCFLRLGCGSRDWPDKNVAEGFLGSCGHCFRCGSSSRIPLQKLPLSGQRNLSTLNSRVRTNSSITSFTACFVSDLAVHFFRNHASRELGFGWFTKLQLVCP